MKGGGALFTKMHFLKFSIDLFNPKMHKCGELRKVYPKYIYYIYINRSHSACGASTKFDIGPGPMLIWGQARCEIGYWTTINNLAL